MGIKQCDVLVQVTQVVSQVECAALDVEATANADYLINWGRGMLNNSWWDGFALLSVAGRCGVLEGRGSANRGTAVHKLVLVGFRRWAACSTRAPLLTQSGRKVLPSCAWCLAKVLRR